MHFEVIQISLMSMIQISMTEKGTAWVDSKISKLYSIGDPFLDSRNLANFIEYCLWHQRFDSSMVIYVNLKVY